MAILTDHNREPEENMVFAEGVEAWEMADETKKLANKYFKDMRYQDAIARYSDTIMMGRKMVPDQVGKTDLQIRELIQSCYLNISMCMLKTEQWEHAYNSAQRALVGDEDPPNPKHDVLKGELKGKAYFRKAQAAFQLLDSSMKHTYESIKKDIENAIKQNASLEKDSEVLKLRRQVQEKQKEDKKSEKNGLKGFLGDSKEDKKANAISVPDDYGKNKAGPSATTGGDRKYDDGVTVNSREYGEDTEFFNDIVGQMNLMREENPEQFKELSKTLKAKCEEKNILPETLLANHPDMSRVGDNSDEEA